MFALGSVRCKMILRDFKKRLTENQTLFLDTLLYLHITYNGIVYILSSKILIERKTKYLIIDSVLY